MIPTRQWIARVVMLLWLVGLILGSQLVVQATDISELQVSNVRNNTFTVSWTTPLAMSGEVRYGTTPQNLNLIAQDIRGPATNDDTHYVTLTGLLPNTTYYFDVVSGGVREDNGGMHHTITTGSTLLPSPPDTIFGQVLWAGTNLPVAGAIVHITLGDANSQGSPGEASLLSALVDDEGFWSLSLSNARTTELDSSFLYSSNGGDQLAVTVQGARDGSASQTINTDNDRPAPSLLLNPPLIAIVESFTASPQGDHILIEWTTSSEIALVGFNLYRGTRSTSEGEPLNLTLIPSQAPGSGQGASYTWLDSTAIEGEGPYHYVLEDIDVNGVSTRHGPIVSLPSEPSHVGVDTFHISSSSKFAIREVSLLMITLALFCTLYRRRR